MWFVAVSLIAAVPPPEPPTAAEAAHRDAVARFGAALLKERRDERLTARKQLEAVIRTEPEALEPLRALFRIYRDLGRDPAAIRTAEKILAIDPDDLATGQTLGRMLLDGKKPKDAARILKRAADSVRIAPQPALALDILSDLVRANEQSVEFAAAEDAQRRIIELHQTKAADIQRANVWSADEQARALGLAWERLGTIRTQLKRPVEAAEAFFKAQAIFNHPDQGTHPAGVVRVYRNLARAYATAGDPARAIEYQVKYLSANPPGYEPYGEYVDLLKARQQFDRILGELQRLDQRRPNHPPLQWALTVEEFRLGKVEASALPGRFRQFMNQSDDPVLDRLAVSTIPARDLIAWMNDLARAANPEKEPSAGDPKLGPLLGRLAAALRNEAAPGRAFCDEYCNEIRVGQQYHKSIGDLVAWLAERSGRWDQAEAAFRAVSGGTWERTSPLVTLLERQRRWQDVIDVCESLGEGRRGSIPAQYAAAFAYAELGKTDIAARYLDRLDRDDRLFAEGKLSVRLQRVRVLSSMGRHEAAIDQAVKLFDLANNPGEVRRVRLALSDAYLGAKRFADSEAELRAILEDDPDDVLALNNLGYHLADQGRKLAEAETLTRRAVALDRDERLRTGDPQPDSGTYLDSLAWAVFRNGKLDEARTLLARALELPDGRFDPTIWDHYGDVLYRLGKAGEAKAAWTTAMRGFTDSPSTRRGSKREEIRRKIGLVP